MSQDRFKEGDVCKVIKRHDYCKIGDRIRILGKCSHGTYGFSMNNAPNKRVTEYVIFKNKLELIKNGENSLLKYI